jgi:hypothetical protein
VCRGAPGGDAVQTHGVIPQPSRQGPGEEGLVRRHRDGLKPGLSLRELPGSRSTDFV